MRYPITLLLACLITACAAPLPNLSIDPKHLGEANVLKWLATQSAGAKFVSHDGEILGGDHDAVLILKSNRQMELTIHGYGSAHYRGKFSVEADGAIRVEAHGRPANWPDLFLYRSSYGTFLLPPVDDPMVTIHPPGAASEMDPFWQFRKIK